MSTLKNGLELCTFLPVEVVYYSPNELERRRPDGASAPRITLPFRTAKSFKIDGIAPLMLPNG